MPIIETVMGIQVIGNNGENIIKSPIVEAYIGSSLLDSTEVASDVPTDISTKVEQMMAAKHSHANKAVLDKFAETDGKPTYDGEALGGGAGDFIIKMTVASDDDGKYTVTSCDATVEQIDAAVAAEKKVVLMASDDGVVFELPMLQGVPGNIYYFGTFMMGQVIASVVENVSANESEWRFLMTQIGAESVSYSNAALPNISTVGDALDELVKKSGHTHDNKSVLDLISAANGKLRYNALDINYAPTQHTYSTAQVSATLADNAEYRMTGLQTLTVQYPEDAKFECWMRLTFAESGNITVTLPAGTEYIGNAPSFANGETWEMSIKDGVVIAQKVGDGT